MMVSAHDAFVTMYYALDAAYEKTKDERLRQYLSDADPFLFRDGGSADPAVYIEFEREYCAGAESAVDEESSLAFVRDYLGRVGPLFIAAFDSIVNLENWKSGLAFRSQ